MHQVLEVMQQLSTTIPASAPPENKASGASSGSLTLDTHPEYVLTQINSPIPGMGDSVSYLSRELLHRGSATSEHTDNELVEFFSDVSLDTLPSVHGLSSFIVSVIGDEDNLLPPHPCTFTLCAIIGSAGSMLGSGRKRVEVKTKLLLSGSCTVKGQKVLIFYAQDKHTNTDKHQYNVDVGWIRSEAFC